MSAAWKRTLGHRGVVCEELQLPVVIPEPRVAQVRARGRVPAETTLESKSDSELVGVVPGG